MALASVYVAADNRGRFKVGMSANPDRRMRQLTRALGTPIRLIFATDTLGWAQFVETTAHWLLVEKHLEGEWFSTSEEGAIAAVQKAVALVSSGHRPLERLIKGGRPLLYPEKVAVPVTPDEIAWIRRLLRSGETRAAFLREAVERELKRRERQKP